MKISNAEIAQLNEFANYLSFQETEQYRLLINAKNRYILEISGNQGGKTGGGAHHYARRFLGYHPIAKKNSDYYVCKHDHVHAIVFVVNKFPNGSPRCDICDEALQLYCEPEYLRIYRFASHNLPGTAGGDHPEVRNTQYPELKKWFPNYLISKDINSRSPVMAVKDIHGGPDILIEFVSYGQDVQATAGPQRKSLWCDEQPPYDFMEEQYPRLLKADGDVLFSLTAADKLSWLYDEYYEKARIIHRTHHVVNAPVVKELFGDLSLKEDRKTSKDICVIQFATDDNPTLGRLAIEELFANIDDKPTLARRRYGMFAQSSGRTLKNFRYDVHVQPMSRWFEAGIPMEWVHARGIDYHQRNDWHFGVASLSTQDEMFVWCEGRYSPELLDIEETAEMIAESTDDMYQFMISVIDPLANTMQGNKRTTIQDLNRYFSELKRKGTGSGGYWTPWDTKSIKGREQLRLRLKNSIRCGVPFNNEVTVPFDEENEEEGYTRFLPTIWIMDTCPEIAKYMRMWRYDENKERDATATKDESENVQQKWSHYPMVLEGILKERSFRPNLRGRMLLDRDVESHRRFSGARR